MFIGASDRVEEGSFYWESTGKRLSYTNWAPGQPDNWQNEDCSGMIFGDPGKWNDGSCDEKCDTCMAMCEKIIPAETRKNAAS